MSNYGRSIIYDLSQDRDYDHSWTWRSQEYQLGQAVQDLLGSTGTYVAGLAATQSGPPSLTIEIGAGAIHQQAEIDANAYGSLADDTDETMMLGLALAQALTLSTAGLTSGQSRWALVWAQYSQVDIIPSDDPDAGVENYLNTSDPSGAPWSGPNNDNEAQNTRRTGVCTIGVTYGTAAATGSEVPPNAPANSVGLYLIDLVYGQTTISNAQIKIAGPSVGNNVPTTYPQAPFLLGLLAMGQYCVDVGAANAYVIGLIGGRQVGVPVRVKIANSNTGASTLQDGGGVVNVVTQTGAALASGQLQGGGIYTFIWDGTHYQLGGSGGGGTGGRTVLSGNTTFYVNGSTGNDTTGNGTSGSPWKTITHAYATVQGTYDLAGYQVTINVAGALTSAEAINGLLVGQNGPVIIQYASGATHSVTNAQCITLSFGAYAWIEGSSGTAAVLSASGTGTGQGNALAATEGSILAINGNLNFGACGSSHLLAGNTAALQILANYTISGSAPTHIYLHGCYPSNFSQNITLTLSGTPNFSVAFLFMDEISRLEIVGLGFSGSATGPRFLIHENSVLYTGGQSQSSYLPGNTAGSVGGSFSGDASGWV